jgi:isopropylmalate/homocitrate/citramalate synthase
MDDAVSMIAAREKKCSRRPPLKYVNSAFESRTNDWWISPFNFSDSVRSQMRLPKEVQICDITLREGRQIEGVSLGLDEVLTIAGALVEAGVSMLQVHHDEPREMMEIKKRWPDVQVEGLVHPTASLNPARCREVVDEIVEHGADIVDLSLCFSEPQRPLFLRTMGREVSPEEALDLTLKSVAYTASTKATPAILLPDPMRMELPYLKHIIGSLIEAGAKILRLDDVVGMGIYPAYKYLFTELTTEFPDATFAFHVHNDIGMGAAALYAAVEGGAAIVDASVNGYGERAGIAPLAEVAAVLQIFYGIDTGIHLDRMTELSELVSDLCKWPIPAKQPCVGDQAFSDLVEVHYTPPPGADWCYSQWKPWIFGNHKRVMLGHYSGPYAIRAKCKALGVEVAEDRLLAVQASLRAHIRERKRAIRDDEFLAIVERVGR